MMLAVAERDQLLQQIAAHAMEWALILLPLAVYLLVLGLGVNRRRHPVMVRGDKNLLGLLLGLSGFLLLGPPSWLAHPFLRWGSPTYWLAYLGYVCVLTGICWGLMFRQRHTWVIYNIDPFVCTEILQEILAELNIPYTATPGRIAFANGRLMLDIDSTSLLYNVSLRWHGGEPALRKAVEDRLAQVLAEVETRDNPAAVLLTFVASMLFMLILFAGGLFLLVPSLTDGW